VKNLELKWIYQVRSLEGGDAHRRRRRDGHTVSANDVIALDARTGRVFWTYSCRPLQRGSADA
jgi:hypothetical protein